MKSRNLFVIIFILSLLLGFSSCATKQAISSNTLNMRKAWTATSGEKAEYIIKHNGNSSPATLIVDGKQDKITFKMFKGDEQIASNQWQIYDSDDRAIYGFGGNTSNEAHLFFALHAPETVSIGESWKGYLYGGDTKAVYTLTGIVNYKTDSGNQIPVYKITIKSSGRNDISGQGYYLVSQKSGLIFLTFTNNDKDVTEFLRLFSGYPAAVNNEKEPPKAEQKSLGNNRSEAAVMAEGPKEKTPWYADKRVAKVEIRDNKVILVNVKTKEEKEVLNIKPEWISLSNGGCKLDLTFVNIGNLVSGFSYKIRLAEKRDNSFGYIIHESYTQIDDRVSFHYEKSEPRYPLEKYILMDLSLYFPDIVTKADGALKISYPSPIFKDYTALHFRSSGIELWDSKSNYSNFISMYLKGQGKGKDRIFADFIKLSDSGDDIIFNTNPVKHSVTVDSTKNFDIIRIDLGNGKFSIKNDAANNFQSFAINSILLVNKDLINNRPYLVENNQWQQLSNGQPSELPEFINTFARDNNSFLDVSGAIIVPIDPVQFKLSDKGLEFLFKWKNVQNYKTINVSISSY